MTLAARSGRSPARRITAAADDVLAAADLPWAPRTARALAAGAMVLPGLLALALGLSAPLVAVVVLGPAVGVPVLVHHRAAGRPGRVAAALPAVNSLLDAIEASESPDVPITIWMEYQHEDEFTLPLRVREHHRVEWLSRTGTGSTMVDAVRAAAFNATGYHAWVAAEAGSTRKVAGLFRQEFGLPRAAVTSRAYWAVGRPR